MAPEQRRRPAPRRTQVVQTEWLTPHLRRIVLGGDGLRDGFAPVHADSYVKVLFLHPGVRYPEPLDLDTVRATFPAQQWPRMRSYTVRKWDAERAELTLDFVVHGDDGVAGPWAAGARMGDVVHLQGPGGAYSPAADTPHHLLIGDESALPAIAAILDRLDPDAAVDAFVEVDGAGDEIALSRHVTWVHRDGAKVGDALLAAVLDRRVDPGTHAFVHGEAGFVKRLRHWLRVEHQLPAAQISISGYWRLGSDDEGWRAGKAAWNAEAEAAEAAAGLRPTG
ncbi:siderophore-interacting protein [uncultured Jatrophihabitans sp.]|uniref:siderophore-interacting protein n=1 Tax=uncultured Jatrophihabitans sp. TaxID=1610747 RepID=UPI0035CAE40B